MKTRTAILSTLAAGALAVTGLVAAPTATSAPQWADADEATIHPGTQTVTDGAQCTSNYVFTDDLGDVYIGMSAHCAGLGEATDTDGCLAGSNPLGTEVDVDGADFPGTLAYSSWLTMQAVGETDASTCGGNDFALVRLDPRDHAKVNPSIPVWGGPVGIGGPTAAGDEVYSFGNSGLRFGIETLSPKYGTSLGMVNDGWLHQVYTVTPGIPGDSGSAYLDADGLALGAVSTLGLAPLPLSNNVTDLGLALDYLAAHTDLEIELALGTEPFTGGPTGLLGAPLPLVGG